MASRTRFDGILIANRGNTNGQKEADENKLAYLQAALKAGWHVCADVVFHQGSFLLPFDGGFNVATPSFFSNQRVWSRCHDADTLDALCTINSHAFFVNETGPTLTSAQFIWTPAPYDLSQRSIAFLPENSPNWIEKFEPAGVCSNCPARYI
jgi:hypothetical protein